VPDLSLNLSSSLGGHVELPDGEVFINPPVSYVENKPCESADQRKRNRFVPKQLAIVPDPDDDKGPFSRAAASNRRPQRCFRHQPALRV